MEQSAIFGPVLATMALTFAVWVFMYVRRISFITRRGLTPEELAVPGRLAEVSPPEVSNPSDNLKNLFEVPVLFYALALYLHATEQVDTLHLAAAWTFVAFRTLHSLVHCTVNIVLLRFWLYAISTTALWLILARAAYNHIVS